MLTEEIRNKLTPVQIVIAEGWEKEREAREKLVSQLENEEITLKQFGEALNNLTPSHCEHGRSIWKTCIACEEIEKIIRPEAFKNSSAEV